MTSKTNERRVLICVENACKVFRARGQEVVALDDFSLDVRQGEFVCLVGASGCGKSTLLKMVAGFFPPTGGRLLLDGNEIADVEPRCGMVFQSYALFPWLNVLENVAFGPRMAGTGRKERRETARRFLALTGLEGFEKAYPGELSGGMRQRVALCRALANEPDILLCDEPFGALDAMTRQILQEELSRIVQQSGQTVLFVTHSIDEAITISDRIVVMSARPGRVKSLYDNDLPRPRKPEMQLSLNYLALKRRVWEDVEEEVKALHARETS